MLPFGTIILVCERIYPSDRWKIWESLTNWSEGVDLAILTTGNPKKMSLCIIKLTLKHVRSFQTQISKLGRRTVWSKVLLHVLCTVYDKWNINGHMSSWRFCHALTHKDNINGYVWDRTFQLLSFLLVLDTYLTFEFQPLWTGLIKIIILNDY